MDFTLHLYTFSNWPTSVQKEFTESTEFIDRSKVEKLEWNCSFALEQLLYCESSALR